MCGGLKDQLRKVIQPPPTYKEDQASISTSNILRTYSRVLWKALASLRMFKSIELISKDRWSVS